MEIYVRFWRIGHLAGCTPGFYKIFRTITILVNIIPRVSADAKEN
jgi:hypothetical protein